MPLKMTDDGEWEQPAGPRSGETASVWRWDRRCRRRCGGRREDADVGVDVVSRHGQGGREGMLSGKRVSAVASIINVSWQQGREVAFPG